MKRPNRALILSALLALLVGAALVNPGSSEASSSSKWKMTVTNPTQWAATVDFWYWDGVGSRTAYKTTIAPGGFYTFSVPGVKCPYGFAGYLIMPDARQAGLRSTNCLGNEASPGEFTPCCWNVNFTVCRKVPATEDPYVRDNDYGFCKN